MKDDGKSSRVFSLLYTSCYSSEITALGLMKMSSKTLQMWYIFGIRYSILSHFVFYKSCCHNESRLSILLYNFIQHKLLISEVLLYVVVDNGMPDIFLIFCDKATCCFLVLGCVE